MGFRESINNLIRNDKPESTSRALALFTGISVIGWVTYALIANKMQALLLILAALLAYICTLLGLKQMDDRKKMEVNNASVPVSDSPVDLGK
jgi:amino acid permease